MSDKTKYTIDGTVIRANGEYVCKLIGYSAGRLHDMMAALAQQPAPAVPDGWKLVPVEPTVEILAAHDALPFRQITTPEEVWAAMLAAAPAAPVAQEPVDADALAASLAPMVTEWVEGGLSMGTDWRHGLARVIALRIRRLATHAARQPDTVAVPRELLERLAGSPDLDPDCCVAYYRQQLRALLAGGEK